MSPDSWEKYVNPDDRFRYDEKPDKVSDRGLGSWHPAGETLEQTYNDIRKTEMLSRNEEIFHKVLGVYLSKKVLVVLAASVLLSLTVSELTPDALFFWNVILFIAVWGYYEMTVRKEVRAEWDDVKGEMENL